MYRPIAAVRPFLAICLGLAICFPASATPPVPNPRPEPKIYRSYQKEMDCLAKAIYFEARGEPVKGQQLVAQVVLNRVDSEYYPDTICDVVYQNDHLKNACQFSFACDDVPDRIDEAAAYRLAKKIAITSFRCDRTCRRLRSGIGSSTHYHADWVQPSWSQKLEKMGKVGSHIFYFTASM